MEDKPKYREPEMVLEKRIGVTIEAYKLLWKEKRIQKKSMARIVDDLIKEKYK